MPYPIQRLFLAAAISFPPGYHPHPIRNAADALDSAYYQVGPAYLAIRKKWELQYTAKRVGDHWEIRRRDDSAAIYLDPKDSHVLRILD
jgi:hypothetical protein